MCFARRPISLSDLLLQLQWTCGRSGTVFLSRPATTSAPRRLFLRLSAITSLLVSTTKLFLGRKSSLTWKRNQTSEVFVWRVIGRAVLILLLWLFLWPFVFCFSFYVSSRSTRCHNHFEWPFHNLNSPTNLYITIKDESHYIIVNPMFFSHYIIVNPMFLSITCAYKSLRATNSFLISEMNSKNLAGLESIPRE